MHSSDPRRASSRARHPRFAAWLAATYYAQGLWYTRTISFVILSAAAAGQLLGASPAPHQRSTVTRAARQQESVPEGKIHTWLAQNSQAS